MNGRTKSSSWQCLAALFVCLAGGQFKGIWHAAADMAGQVVVYKA